MCSRRQARKQANAWAAEKASETQAGVCDMSFIPRFAAYTSSKNPLIVSVGCSRGYHDALMFGYFWGHDSPAPAFYPSGLNENHMDHGPAIALPNPCGKCNECKVGEPNLTRFTFPQREHLQLVCFEPASRLHPVLSHASDFFFPSYWPQVLAQARWIIQPHAVADVAGRVGFTPDCAQNCSIEAASRFNVSATTIDRLAVLSKIARIHHLRINAAGHEDKVLYGAHHTLQRHAIDSLHFHYNGRGYRTRKPSLQAMVMYLAGLGYGCYWPESVRSPYYYKITGCWSEAYEGVGGTSNVVCVRNGHPLREHLDDRSHLAVLRHNTGIAV